MRSLVITTVVLAGLAYSLPMTHEDDHSNLRSHIMEDLAELLEFDFSSSPKQSQDFHQDHKPKESRPEKDKMSDDIEKLLKEVELDTDSEDDVESDPSYRKKYKLKPGQILSSKSIIIYLNV